MIFIIYLMIEEMKLLLKLRAKYVKEFWSMINVGIIVCSWTNVGIYVWRHFESKHIGELFSKTHGYTQINLQMAVYVDDLYRYLLGFCCFFGTIKFVRLCRYNRRLLYFIETLQHARGHLLSFSMMFSIVFVSFVSLYYLLFSSKLFSCSTLLETSQMLFEMTLMKFDANEISNAAAFLGPFCFSLFVFVVVFVCMSMFLTIINESFRHVRDNAKNNAKTDDHIFSFMWMRFQQWSGLSRRDELDEFIRSDEQMRSKYVDPIENFPDKIDQLLGALNRVRLEFKKNEIIDSFP